MTHIATSIVYLLNWIWVHILTPVASATGKGLEIMILKPLSGAGLDPFWQVLIVGVLTAFISIFIAKLLRTEAKEERFRKIFLEKKAIQENFKNVEDWKMKKVLYETSDSDLDEEYNNFVAQKFAHFGATYLLPIFLILFWLNLNFPVEKLMEITGSNFLLLLPKNPIHLKGLSVPVTFFIGYLPTITLGKRLIKRLASKTSRINVEINSCQETAKGKH